jgi:hypothetical protein
MTKAFFAMLFLAVAVALSVTASGQAFAQLSSACEPGCNCQSPAPAGPKSISMYSPLVNNPDTTPPWIPRWYGGEYPKTDWEPNVTPNSMNNQGGFLGASQRHADVVSLRNRAYAREGLPQNDNAPGMACFDRAMGLTSRLGGYFSDVAPSGVVAADTNMFGTLVYPKMGIGTYLGDGMDKTLSEGLRNHMSGFMGSLSAGLGAIVGSALSSWVNQYIMPIIDTLVQPLQQLCGIIAQFNGYMSQIYGLFRQLGIIMPPVVQAVVGALNIIWQRISEIINSAISAVMNIITRIINQIQSLIQGALSSLLSFATPGGECSRMAQIWGNGQPAGFRPLMGAGAQRGTPYVMFSEVMMKSIPDTQGNAGRFMQSEVASTNNDVVARMAREDVSNQWEWVYDPFSYYDPNYSSLAHGATNWTSEMNWSGSGWQWINGRYYTPALEGDGTQRGWYYVPHGILSYPDPTSKVRPGFNSEIMNAGTTYSPYPATVDQIIASMVSSCGANDACQ